MLVSIRHPINPGRMFVEEVHDMTEAVLRFGTESEIKEVEKDGFVFVTKESGKLTPK